MSFDLALRMTEILMAFAFLQQSAEHFCASKDERRLFQVRGVLAGSLLFGIWTPWVCLGLLVNSLFILNRFQGPYNGGSDRMGLLVLCCVCIVHVLPYQQWQELIFGYLAVQLTLSYFMSGWVKIWNPEWRSGQALQDVFRFSAYPVSEGIRAWAEHPKLLWVMSWAVILFELIFPLTLLTQTTLIIGLIIAAIFHLANAFLFGLNRFFWIWLAAYPSILWLQARLFDQEIILHFIISS